MVPIPTEPRVVNRPSIAKLSTSVTAVSIVVVVPCTVKLPLNVPSTAVTFPDADTFTPLTFPVAARLPVTLAPVDIACTFTSLPDLIALGSPTPDNPEPSPWKEPAVIDPPMLTLPAPEIVPVPGTTAP